MQSSTAMVVNRRQNLFSSINYPGSVLPTEVTMSHCLNDRFTWQILQYQHDVVKFVDWFVRNYPHKSNSAADSTGFFFFFGETARNPKIVAKTHFLGILTSVPNMARQTGHEEKNRVGWKKEEFPRRKKKNHREERKNSKAQLRTSMVSLHPMHGYGVHACGEANDIMRSTGNHQKG